MVDSRGLLLCSRYSFAPNSLHYCGPERQNDMRAYVTHGVADNGLTGILNRFETLYPYLNLIACHNNISDPFDRRVVEAYWIGNTLIRGIPVRAFASHLVDTLELKKKVKAGALQPMVDRMVGGGLPQHTFHVLNIFIRTGHHAAPQTLSTMNDCRISWGRVVKKVQRALDNKKDDTAYYIVKTKPLVYTNDRLELGPPALKTIVGVGISPSPGDVVSIHWGYICDVLTLRQQRNLARYTFLAIQLANRSV